MIALRSLRTSVSTVLVRPSFSFPACFRRTLHRAMASPLTADELAAAAQLPIPWPGSRTYEGAIQALNSLQSNAAFIEAKRKAGPQFVDGLPVEIENLKRAGHQVGSRANTARKESS